MTMIVDGSGAGAAPAGGPQDAPTAHFTTAQAAAFLNRGDASWTNGELFTPTTLTFAFRAHDATTYTRPYPGAFEQFNSQQIQMALLALQSWSDVANITFDRNGSGLSGANAYRDNGTILFGNYARTGSAPEGAYSWTPDQGDRSSGGYEGDVWVNSRIGANVNPQLWNYGLHTLTHELGHAIGFEHPGDYNAGEGNPTYDDASFIEDTAQYTVMSYWEESHTGGDFHGDYAPAPLLIDIAAAQRLYGANLSFQTGDTVYGFNSNASREWYKATASQPPIFCAWDAGGTDTFDFSGYAVKQTIDLRNEAFSDVGGYKHNVSVAMAVKVDGVIVNYIENAIGGSSKDTIIGNNADNMLDGRLGDDILAGGKGNDNLIGGDGHDVLTGSKGFDTLFGGLGQDDLQGNKNNDLFLFTALGDSVVGAEDVIIKGLDRLDTIDLSQIDAVAGSGNQAFHLGGAAFTNSAGELIRFYHAGSDTTYIQGDVDGDGDADLSIKVLGDYHTFANFVL